MDANHAEIFPTELPPDQVIAAYPPPISAYYGVRNIRGTPTWYLKRAGEIYLQDLGDQARKNNVIVHTLPIVVYLRAMAPDARRKDTDFLVKVAFEFLQAVGFEPAKQARNVLLARRLPDPKVRAGEFAIAWSCAP